MIAGVACGTKSQRELEDLRKPGQKVKPAAKAAEGSLAAPEFANADASRKLYRLVDPEDARTGGEGILIDGSAGDATFAQSKGRIESPAEAREAKRKPSRSITSVKPVE